jgi:hypothetical protein
LGLAPLASAQAQAIGTGIFLAVALVALLYRARTRRGYGPFWLGLGAASLVLITKFLLGWDPGTYAGVGLLITAGLWNVWPRGIAGEDCAACTDATVQ